MAGPTITVAVLSDTKKVKQGLEETGEALEDVGRKARSTSEKVDDLDGKANSAEKGFRGFADSLNGTNDVMGGLQSGNLVQLGMGMADLFGSIQDLFLPLLQQMAVKLGLVTVATEGQTAAQEASNVAMAANPIGIVVLALAALAAAFYVAWTKSETFRDIVTGALDAVRVAFETLVGFVTDHWQIMLAVLTGGLSQAVIEIVRHWQDIQGAVSRVFNTIDSVAGPILDGIRRGFDFVRDGVEFLIDAIQRLIDKIKGPLSAVAGIVHDIAGGIGGAAGAVGGALGLKSAAGAKGNDLGATGNPFAGNNLALSNDPVQLRATGGQTFVYYPAGYNRSAITDAQRQWQRLNGGGIAPR